MNRTDKAPLGRLLPSTHPVVLEPGSVVLKLEATGSREGALDGAWWPRSRNVNIELPPLLTELTLHLGQIARVGLDSDFWEGPRKPVFIDGRLVHIDWFPEGDDTIIVTRGHEDHFSLLVIPSRATHEEAQEALNMTFRADNSESGSHILFATGITEHGPV